MALRLTLSEPLAVDSMPPGHAVLDAISGDRVTVLTLASAPPGAPVELVSAAAGAPTGRVFEGRVRSCQRVDLARYRLELRLVNLSKPARQELEALMARSRPQR
ncbi:MAG TPA: hypothetical protein VFU02_07350 [Polyangiaceae bacterium]|nr:hypothetical protein [Polyangiaceae bacterium]